MMTPAILALSSLAASLYAILAPAAPDWAIVALPALLASLFLLGQAALRQRPAAKRWIVVDGSNVMHWKDNTPDLGTLARVVQLLGDQGFSPVVIFDANAGYLVNGRYRSGPALGRQIGLPGNQATVVPRGTPADPVILARARALGARIVTNDRYRDWADDHPEIASPGHLVRGGLRGPDISLDLRRA
jgi:hypothetical protein